jgi:Response regulators consisting of a CheY-like receiver domain and a winged-helix DNA-binding domain
MKILIVEDDESLREMMQNTLKAEKHVVETASDFASGLLKIEDYDYDCILLDIMLPGGNGIDLLRRLKELEKSANVIIISAKDALEDKLLGLDLGADDYLTKPFHIAELSARMRSVSRRKNQNGQNHITQGNVTVHPDSHKVEVDGKTIELMRKEYDILCFFMTRPGHTISKSTLAEAVWGDFIDQADNYDFIYAQMKNLRKKLLEAKANIEIKAVYGFGYKLVNL